MAATEPKWQPCSPPLFPPPFGCSVNPSEIAEEGEKGTNCFFSLSHTHTKRGGKSGRPHTTFSPLLPLPKKKNNFFFCSDKTNLCVCVPPIKIIWEKERGRGKKKIELLSFFPGKKKNTHTQQTEKKFCRTR